MGPPSMIGSVQGSQGENPEREIDFLARGTAFGPLSILDFQCWRTQRTLALTASTAGIGRHRRTNRFSDVTSMQRTRRSLLSPVQAPNLVDRMRGAILFRCVAYLQVSLSLFPARYSPPLSHRRTGFGLIGLPNEL